MKHLKNIIFFCLFLLANPNSVRADFWGGDLPLLAQILANSIQQLAQLRQILSAGQDNLQLMREINRGINDALNLVKTVSPNSDPGLYRDWQKVDQALYALENIYGVVVQSKDSQVQKNTDQSVAEAITLNNSIYDYTKQIDEIGEEIKRYSHEVSPGGAQKLTAQSMGVMLHVMNQSLRTQATGLKLQAQTLAIENRKDKAETKNALDTSSDLTAAMQSEDPTFTLPRF